MIWQSDFETVTAERISSFKKLSGGDIGSSYCIRLESGDRCFVKHYPDAAEGQTHAEAEGLRWLNEPGEIRVAQVIAVGEQWLALEWIECAQPGPHSAALLGRQLARLHAAGAPRIGADHDNWIGRLAQSNGEASDWPSFYVDRRLRPLVLRARHESLLGAEATHDFEQLYDRVEQIVGPHEPPARLHGDLWSGNLLFDQDGAPWLIDPAAYGGHREVDLAMMKLFGGFQAEVFEAYHREAPLNEGSATRIDLYQLYPLLVHLLLFGESYTSSVMAALHRLLRS